METPGQIFMSVEGFTSALSAWLLILVRQRVQTLNQ
jgi:hypothetical protein